MIRKVLGLIASADKVFQAWDTGLIEAMNIIVTVHESLKELRSKDTFEVLIKDAEDMLRVQTEDTAVEAEPLPKRIRMRNVRLADSIIMETTGERDDDGTVLRSLPAYIV